MGRFLIDLHCHSKYSNDNYLEPELVIREAIEKKLNGVCFTEHHSFDVSSPVEEIMIPEGFYVFRGIEISTNLGHLLVYGLENDDWNVWHRNNYLDCIKVMERIRASGGICIPAHPFRGYDSFGDNIDSIHGFDAVETHNGLNTEDANLKAICVSFFKNVPSIGGSDCHKIGQVGEAYTEFKNRITTIEALIKEIRMGNCKGVLRPKCIIR